MDRGGVKSKEGRKKKIGVKREEEKRGGGGGGKAKRYPGEDRGNGLKRWEEKRSVERRG